jgi:hypothetical protein
VRDDAQEAHAIRSNIPWDPRVLSEILATGHTQALVVIDHQGRVVQRYLARELTSSLVELSELVLAAQLRFGQHLSLGQPRLSMTVHERGVLVCGTSREHHVLLLASELANLGQLVNFVRRFFPACD